MNETTATELIESPSRVDVAFPLGGERVPDEHGYGLFGAMCRVLSELHGAPWLSVHPIRGAPLGDGMLGLAQPNRALRLRVHPAQLSRVLSLAGATLSVEGYRVTVGAAEVFALRPAATLAARMVVIRDDVERAEFEQCLHERLAAMGVRATAEIPGESTLGAGPHADGRRVLRIRGQVIVGYPVILRGLSDEHSLRVQTLGIGGRQRFGCGVFAEAGSGD